MKLYNNKKNINCEFKNILESIIMIIKNIK